VKSRLSLILVCALLGGAARALADEPGPPKIPGLVEGPIKISPWFAASQPKPSAAQNHYAFSVPPLLYYGYFGSGVYGYGSYGPNWYGYGIYRPFYRVSPYRFIYP
jgi:hypothetical protein